MECGKGFRWRKRADLKPIVTKREEEEREEKKSSINGERSSGGEEWEPLSPSSRLFHEPNFNVYVVAIMGLKTRIYPDVIKANLGHTLLKHPRFSSLQVADEKSGGGMKWVRTQVDLERHLIVPELDPNMDPSSADKLLEDYIFNLTKTTIDKSQPLWDLHLLNLTTSQAESVAIFRAHHSLGDGTSLMSLLLACTRQVKDPNALPTLPTMKKKKPEIIIKKKNEYLRGFGRIMLMFLSVFQVFWNTLVDIFMFMATALFLDDSENPIKGQPPPATAGVEIEATTARRIVYRTVSLDDMKLIKNAMNSTINDVALGMTQAGLSRYINRIYGGGNNNQNDGGAKMDSNHLPKNIRLRSVLLVNIRPSAGIQAMADMMEKDSEAKWGNKFGYVLLPFTIALRENPLDYVGDAKATTCRKKRSLEALFTYSIADLLLKLFGVKAASALSDRVMPRTTMAFSNLVGPVEEIGYYGHPLAFLAPTSYGQPHALMINFQSYVDKMTMVLSVDEGTIPNPHQLCDDIVDSLRLIKDALATSN